MELLKENERGANRAAANVMRITVAVFVVVLVLDSETGSILHGPEMFSKGFVFEQRYSHVLEDAKCLVLDEIESVRPGQLTRLQDGIRSSLRRFFRRVLERDPVVVPVVTEI